MTGGDDDIAVINGKYVWMHYCSDHKVLKNCTDNEMEDVVRPYKDDNFIS